MIYITLILEILKNLSKVLPQWYEGWAKRKDLSYLEKRAEIRKKKAKLWNRIKEATGEEKEKLLQDYLDRFIRNR